MSGRTKRRRAVFAAFLALALVALLETLARGYLRLTAGGSLLHPDEVVYGFYPELRRVRHALFADPDKRADAYDVLLLGGSALHPEWGAIEAVLGERIADELGRPVRIHNLAKPGHTTRDSLVKYERLADARFDLVVVYHGINETRANCAPKEVFREDYGHYSWYARVNAMERDHLLRYVALPYAARHAALTLSERLGLRSVVPADEPPPAWVKHCGEVKTRKSFHDNLAAILDLAHGRGDPVLLVTFAIHVADGYSDAAFDAMRLDYVRHRSPLWWWGTPASVRAGVDAHNQVTRELARERGVPLVDEAALLPGERIYWNDVCHLTVAGSQRFVDGLMPAVREALAERRPR